MSKYSTTKGPFDSVRYRKDGRLISVKEIPDNIVQVLRHNPVFIEETVEPPRDKACIFCGQESKLFRVVDTQSVYLCNQHYYSESLGKVASKLRSSNG